MRCIFAIFAVVAAGCHGTPPPRSAPATSVARAGDPRPASRPPAPLDAKAYDAAFRRAEALHQLEQWEQAAVAFRKVVAMDRKGRHAERAALAAVVACKNLINTKDERGPVRGIEPRPIPAHHRRLVAAIDDYLALVPAAKDRPVMLYRKARIYYENNHFERALAPFAEIATRHPDHELAEYAANLLLDSLNILKRHDEMARWVDRFLKQPKLARGELAQTLIKLQMAQRRRALEQLMQRKQYRECGEGYAALADRYPTDPRYAELVYNAAVCFEQARQLERSVVLFRRLVTKPGRSGELARKALERLATAYETLGQDREAATQLETYARKYPGERFAMEALERAVALRVRLGDRREALADAELFARNYGARKGRAERVARVLLAAGEVNRGRPDEAVRYYGALLRRWGNSAGPALQARARLAIGDALWRRACPVKGVDGICGRMEPIRGKHCRQPLVRRLSSVPRRPAMVKQARQHLDRALELSGQAGKGHQELRCVLASMRFLLAETLMDLFVQIQLPRGLDLSASPSRPGGLSGRRRMETLRAFATYLDTKGKALARARTAYQEVILTKDPQLTVAAMARVSQMFLIFAEALDATPIPPGLQIVPRNLTGAARQQLIAELSKTYCEVLLDRTTPLLKKAEQGFEACVARAAELKQTGRWSKLCADQLKHMRRLLQP